MDREFRDRDIGRASQERIIRQLEISNRVLFLVVGVLLGVIFIGSYNYYLNKQKAVPIDTALIVDKKIHFKANHNTKKLIEENYIKYLNKAYILIGDYPDCEYIKISANVSRNDYNWENEFYVDEKGLYYNHFKDGKKTGKIAIDVSEFQGVINWESVKKAGVDVAIIRIGYRGYGEGTIMADHMAADNLDGAAKAKIETGVYFFSSAINREEGEEEAKFVLENLGKRKLKQPVVIDTEYVFENDGARANNISIKDRTDAVVGFCETIEAAGYTPMIYASRDQFIKYLDIDRIGKWEFWLAAYDIPVFPYHTEAYQYSPCGYVDGIDTQVDLDVWMR